jgi:predicted HNH restriction endonuclease
MKLFKYDAKTQLRRVKMQLIMYKGGKCVGCELIADTTNQCCFEFHHLNPTKKGTSQMKYANGWKPCKTEADKCILVCSNCHKMIHYT